MSINTARQDVKRARLALTHAELALHRDCVSWRQRFHQHRTGILLGGGFLAGVALTVLPPKVWARVGSFVGGSAAWLVQSPFSPSLFGALFSLVRARPKPKPDNSPTSEQG